MVNGAAAIVSFVLLPRRYRLAKETSAQSTQSFDAPHKGQIVLRDGMALFDRDSGNAPWLPVHFGVALELQSTNT